ENDRTAAGGKRARRAGLEVARARTIQLIDDERPRWFAGCGDLRKLGTQGVRPVRRGELLSQRGDIVIADRFRLPGIVRPGGCAVPSRGSCGARGPEAQIQRDRARKERGYLPT